MAIRVRLDLIVRRRGVDGDKFATRPDRFAGGRIIDRACGGFVDLLALPGFFSTAAVDVRGRDRVYRGRPLHRHHATRSCCNRARVFQ